MWTLQHLNELETLRAELEAAHDALEAAEAASTANGDQTLQRQLAAAQAELVQLKQAVASPKEATCNSLTTTDTELQRKAMKVEHAEELRLVHEEKVMLEKACAGLQVELKHLQEANAALECLAARRAKMIAVRWLMWCTRSISLHLQKHLLVWRTSCSLHQVLVMLHQ